MSAMLQANEYNAGDFGCDFKPKRPAIFMLLPGGWTGDMWHCAAATGFCQSLEVIAAFPVTVLGMQEKVFPVAGGKLAVNVDASTSVTRGYKTFDYLVSIGMPVLLARISKLEKKFQNFFSRNIAPDNLHEMVAIYRRDILKASGKVASCKGIWFASDETDAANNAESWTLGRGQKDVPSARIDDLFKNAPDQFDQEIEPPYKFDRSYAGIGASLPFRQLWISTTIVMQHLHAADTRVERLKLLQKLLGGTQHEDSAWCKAAKDLVTELVKLTGGKKTVLFNYRVGDVNRQHDGSLELLQYVAGVAAKKGFEIIAVMVNVSATEAQAVKDAKFATLDLYKPGVMYDKRYTAAFWAYVTAADDVFGLIGGRSGSMDIASFMGVNCASWDEPVLDSRAGYPDSYVGEQGGQLLRLLSQRCCTSIVYVNIATHYESAAAQQAVAAGKIRNPWNSYKELNTTMVELWLDRKPDVTKATIGPQIKAAALRGALARSYTRARGDLEDRTYGIQAVGLDTWTIIK